MFTYLQVCIYWVWFSNKTYTENSKFEMYEELQIQYTISNCLPPQSEKDT